MRVWGVLGAVLLVGLVAGCDPPAQLGAGERCNSLSDCKLGLSCIEGVCDDDISSIAGQVPVYADAAAAAGAGTGGATGGSAQGDAGAAP